VKGNLIIISSPSGGGKGTLIREVLDRVPNIGYSVSLTTRAPRYGEENGKHYQFVSKDEFEAYKEKGGFLEFAEVHGNYYGTAHEEIQRVTGAGNDIVLEIDVQGAASVLAKVPQAVSIFILPPSFEVLQARLTARATEGMQDLELRLRNSQREVMEYSHFKYAVVNDEVETAARKIVAIILAERQRPDRQSDVISAILGSFERSKV
jgi:guanylate kinase